MSRGKATEVDAYRFIKRKLAESGWCTKNPERNPDGQVWTQNECLSNPRLKLLLGLEKPENIVKMTESRLWVFEAKRSHSELPKALAEAKDYAVLLNRGDDFDVPLVSGVAGNDDDGFLVATETFVDGTWVPVTINGIPATGVLSPSDCTTLLNTGGAELSDPPIDERRFVATAERINNKLDAGNVPPHDRAKVVSALLLSMINPGSPPNIEEKDTTVLIGDINTRVVRVLKEQSKVGFADHIRIPVPSAQNNHAVFRKALVEALQELRGLNIHSAMRSGADWLGTFYEVFLKYARWAQKLGIVLTPRHVTRFAARIMNISSRDIVYDPTCGTGGFLVAAFEQVKQTASVSQLEAFKRRSVFGLEIDDGIAALAVVNMIFRGDGKNNIEQANCITRHLAPHTGPDGATAKFADEPSSFPPVTRVLMNPPFTRKNSQHKDYEFVSYALKQLEDKGLLFSVLPYSVMAKGGGCKTWREELLKNHTLVAVVTFPDDLFYPVGVFPAAIVVKKGVPHPPTSNVLWVRAETDGQLKSKGKRLPNETAGNQLTESEATLKAFINDQSLQVESWPRRMIAAPVNYKDTHLELVPEAYLEQEEVSADEVDRHVDAVLRDCSAFLIRNGVTAAWDGEDSAG